MSSRTRMTTFGKLNAAGELGPILVRIMMSINDLGLADDSLAAWHTDQDRARKNRSAGAKMYFVRLQIAHIFEAFKIIYKITITPDLMRAVDQCDRPTQDSFQALVCFLGTEEYKMMKKVRNNITFHYLHDTVAKALEGLAAQHPNAQLSLTMGSRSIDWYCEPSDRIIDNAVVRDIFNVPEDADLPTEVDKIVVRLQEVGELLVNFGGNFIFQHAGRS